MALRNKAILDLPMTAQSHDPTNGRALDLSPNALHASFGAGAAAPTKIAGQRGYTFDGGDHMTGATQGKFNQVGIALCLLLRPTFASDDNTEQFIFDTSATGRIMIRKTGVGPPANALHGYMGATNIFAIAVATWGPFWKQYQYNTLILTGTTGDNQYWLNNNSIGTNATAWAAASPDNYYIGCENSLGATKFDGDILAVQLYPFRMTAIQAADWHQRALRTLNAV